MQQQYLPSELAAMAVFASRRAMSMVSWTETLVFHTGYSKAELMPIAMAFLEETETFRELNLKGLNKNHHVRYFDALLNRAFPLQRELFC